MGTSLKKLSTCKSSHFCPCCPSVVPSHRQVFIWDSSPPPASPRPAIYILTSPSALSLAPAWCIEPASVSTSRLCHVCKLFFSFFTFFSLTIRLPFLHPHILPRHLTLTGPHPYVSPHPSSPSPLCVPTSPPASPCLNDPGPSTHLPMAPQRRHSWFLILNTPTPAHLNR